MSIHAKFSLVAILFVTLVAAVENAAFGDLKYSIHEAARMASVNHDDETSFKLYFVLAQNGNGDAQLLVGHAYAEGKGVRKDYVQAYMWGKIVSNRPESDQKIPGMEITFKESMNKNLRKLAYKMSRKQRQKAERLAREWKPTKELEVTPEIEKLLGPHYQKNEFEEFEKKIRKTQKEKTLSEEQPKD